MNSVIFKYMTVYVTNEFQRGIQKYTGDVKQVLKQQFNVNVFLFLFNTQIMIKRHNWWLCV